MLLVNDRFSIVLQRVENTTQSTVVGEPPALILTSGCTSGGHPAGEGAAYGYPECAHVATYLRDMGDGCGATELIVGSHRDGSSTPEESPGRRVAFNLRAQDAAVYDQRCYHRRGRFAPAQSGDPVRLFLNMAHCL